MIRFRTFARNRQNGFVGLRICFVKVSLGQPCVPGHFALRCAWGTTGYANWNRFHQAPLNFRS